MGKDSANKLLGELKTRNKSQIMANLTKNFVNENLNMNITAIFGGDQPQDHNATMSAEMVKEPETMSSENEALDVIFGHHDDEPAMEINSVYAYGESEGEGASQPDDDFKFAA